MDLSCLDYQKLMKTLNVGLFRAVIDYKGRFIFANETTVKILGFDDFGELAETRIIKMIADSEDKVKLRNTLKSKGFIKDKVLKIQKKNGDFVTVSVTLSALDITEHGDLICDGIIEDITDAESKKSQTENLIAELKSNSFLIEQPIKNYISPIYTIDSDATINDAIKAITLKKTDNLLLTKSAKDYIGFITNADIQKRVLALNLHLENPAYLIMSSPVVYVFENTSVFDALNISDEKKINHLVVKSETGQIIGVLRINDIYRTLKNSLSFLIHNIKNSETIDDLKQEYKKFQLLVKPLINSEVSVKFITNITSSFSDSVTKKIIELSINEIGEPPVCFSFICLGSEGRMEETLFTDQDNAIVYENVPSELEVAVNKYFNSLGEKVCNSLNEVGYLFCKGNIMAKNPQWCQSISVWEQNFANWIATPESQNLLDATIFFDFRIVYGNETLTDRLKLTIDNLVKEYPMFFYHLAYNTFNTKAPQISTGNIISDKLIDNFDLKSAVNLIIMFARIYSLKNNLWLTNTLERLNNLKAKQIVNPASIDEIIFAYNFLMKLRFKNQVVLLDNNMPLSNQLNTKKMIDIELQILKKVLSVIPSFQNKLNFDFKLTK
jgi:PAS domain S-box-containing protein